MEVDIMKGTITKKNFFEIWKSFGWKKAVQILFSSHQSALTILMA
jgi:hypothetical protein